MNLVAMTLLLIACMLLPSGLALGQSNLGTITGVVTDGAGSIVPGADVTITNTNTGVALNTRTNNEGVYVAPSLKPDPYSVRVQTQGFKTSTRETVLQTAQSLRLDVTLETGNISETVTVEASSAPLLTRESAEVSTTISSAQVSNLPLKGRNPYSALILTPGISPSSADPSSPGGRSSVNGSRSSNTIISLDGAPVTGAAGATERIGTIEALQEVKVLTSNYSAEYAQGGGGVILFQVKSGTNKYRGSLYEFHNDSSFNASNWADNANNIAATKNRRAEFGATLGGPVPFSKKLFFFASYEGDLGRDGFTRRRTIPDLDLRNGDFSRLRNERGEPLVFIRDPQRSGLCQRTPSSPQAGVNYQAACFPNNIIPPQRRDPAAIRVLQALPAPNLSGVRNSTLGFLTENYARPGVEKTVNNYFTSRIDYVPNELNRFFFTLSHQKTSDREIAVDFDSPLNTEGDSVNRRLTRGALSYNRIFSPTLSYEFLLAATQDHRVLSPVFFDVNATEEFGIQRTVGQGLPTINFSGAGGFGSYGDSSFADSKNLQTVMNNTVTYLKGRHTMRFGAQIHQIQNPYVSSGNASGSYNFTGEITGAINNPVNSLADFIVGAVRSAQATAPQLPITYLTYDYGFFFQDDFKVLPRLTLNLGLRYEFETAPVVRNDVYSRIDPVTGSLLVAGRNADRKLNRRSDFLNFGPRLGFAYSYNDDTVFRGGFGVLHSGAWLDAGIRPNYPGFSLTQSFPALPGGAAREFRFSQGFPVAANVVPDPLALFAAATPATPFAATAFAVNAKDPRPYNMQWTLSVQRAVPFSAVVDIAYVGSRGVHLSNFVPANNPTLDRSGPGSLTQALRPFPALSAFGILKYDATSDYHALQAKAARRFSSGLSLDLAYTFSKTMDDASSAFSTARPAGIPAAQIPWQFPELERALAGTDRKHYVAAAWLYELPFGRGRRFLDEGLLSKVVGGFQLNGMLTAASGLPLTITQTTVNRVLAAQRPNVIENRGQSGQLSEPVFDPDLRGALRWLVPRNDPDFPFTPSGSTGFGNLSRNTSRGPGFWNLNLSLFRRFSLGERITVEFRAEAFNALNHPNFGNHVTNIDSASYGLITSAADARAIQLGAKLTF